MVKFALICLELLTKKCCKKGYDLSHLHTRTFRGKMYFI